MKRLIFIISLFISVSFQGQGLISFGTIASSGSSWIDRMAASYVSINSHSTFTQLQIDTIKGRLAEVESVFGPLGLNKTTCDFFMFFENSNKTTNLITRTNTKTGATLRWDYGAVAYNQNNLPAQTCNGYISVTSTDGFGGWASFNISNNTFINHVFNISMLPNVINYYIHSNIGLNSNINTFILPSTLQNITINNTALNGNLGAWVIPSGLRLIQANVTSISGDISLWLFPNSTTEIYLNSTSVSGAVPNITPHATNGLVYQLNSTPISTSNLSTFRKAMTVLNLQNCYLNTAQIDALLAAMDAYFVGPNLMTANCTITLDGATMGIPTGGVNNVNILSLLAKATGQSKLWSFVIRT